MMAIRRLCLAFFLWAAMLAPVLAAPPPQQGQTVHVVQAGETLYLIARQYGITVEAIVVANGIADPDQIYVGQRLAIPSDGSGSAAATFAPYTVQPGDTLAIIARRNGMTVQALAQANHLVNPNLIYVGQSLLVPTGTGGALKLGGAAYVVQAGDTLARIAARYGTSVWALAQANSIANPSMIYVGQRLWIPTSETASSLPLPFVELRLLPLIAVQGQTVQLAVKTEGEVSLSGTFDGRPLFFVGGQGLYRTLIGIHAMAGTGLVPLDLKAVAGEREVSVRSMVQVAAGSFDVQYLTLPSDKAALLDPDLVAAEAARVWEVTTQATLPGAWQSAFMPPLGGELAVTGRFGVRRSYEGGPATSYHAGIDYSADEGAPVYSAAPGRVVLAEPLHVRGAAVIVDHGRGVMTGYWHLSQIAVTPGQRVEVGNVLGYVGSTGLSTGPHLHWELRVMGIPVDPLQWLSAHIE